MQLPDRMRDVTDDDMDSASRGLGMAKMSKAELEEVVAQNVKNWDLFASRVIVMAALRQLGDR